MKLAGVDSGGFSLTIQGRMSAKDTNAWTPRWYSAFCVTRRKTAEVQLAFGKIQFSAQY